MVGKKEIVVFLCVAALLVYLGLSTTSHYGRTLLLGIEDLSDIDDKILNFTNSSSDEKTIEQGALSKDPSCSRTQLMGKVEGIWKRVDQSTSLAINNCPYIKARYNCPFKISENISFYEWKSELETSAICKIERHLNPNEVGERILKMVEKNTQSKDLQGKSKDSDTVEREEIIPKGYIPGKKASILLLGDSYLRELVETIACSYSDLIIRRVVMPNNDPKVDYNRCHGYKREDLKKFYNEEQDFGPHLICVDDYMIIEFEKLEIVYSFHEEGLKHFNLTSFNYVFSNKEQYFCKSYGFTFTQKFWVHLPYLKFNQKNQRNTTDPRYLSTILPKTCGGPYLDLNFLHHRKDAMVYNPVFPQGDIHLCIPGPFDEVARLFFHFLSNPS